MEDIISNYVGKKISFSILLFCCLYVDLTKRSVILNYLWDKCKRGRMAACKGDICRGAHTPEMEVYSPAITSRPPRLLWIHVKLIESKDSFRRCIKRFERMLLTIGKHTPIYNFLDLYFSNHGFHYR